MIGDCTLSIVGRESWELKGEVFFDAHIDVLGFQI
jgi:hypothetical protein